MCTLQMELLCPDFARNINSFGYYSVVIQHARINSHYPIGVCKFGTTPQSASTMAESLPGSFS